MCGIFVAIFYCASEKQDPIRIIKRKLEGFHAYMEVNVFSITVLIALPSRDFPVLRTVQMLEQMLQGMEDDGTRSAPSPKGFWLFLSWDGQ